jgi:hypothetical protein
MDDGGGRFALGEDLSKDPAIDTDFLRQPPSSTTEGIPLGTEPRGDLCAERIAEGLEAFLGCVTNQPVERTPAFAHFTQRDEEPVCDEDRIVNRLEVVDADSLALTEDDVREFVDQLTFGDQRIGERVKKRGGDWAGRWRRVHGKVRYDRRDSVGDGPLTAGVGR